MINWEVFDPCEVVDDCLIFVLQNSNGSSTISHEMNEFIFHPQFEREGVLTSYMKKMGWLNHGGGGVWVRRVQPMSKLFWNIFILRALLTVYQFYIWPDWTQLPAPDWIQLRNWSLVIMARPGHRLAAMYLKHF